MTAGRQRELAGAFAADDQRRSATAAGHRPPAAQRSRSGQPGSPGEREVLDGLLVDLRQRAVALAGVVAVVGRPRVGQRLEELGRIEALAPAPAGPPARASSEAGPEQFFECHLSVARYAVTSCMSLSVESASSALCASSGSLISTFGLIAVAPERAEPSVSAAGA